MRHGQPLTEADLRRIARLPVAVINISSLPYPPSGEYDPTPGELRANTTALRRILATRMADDPGLKPLRKFTPAELQMALLEEAPNCLRMTQSRPPDELSADTIAAHREIRAMTMIALDNRPIPQSDIMRRWAEGHDGERITCRDRDVINLRRSFNRLAEKLESRPDILREDLQALAYLNRNHEFVLPLAQQITALTVKAAAQFVPSLVGA